MYKRRKRARNLKNARPYSRATKARSRGPGGYLGFGLPVGNSASDIIASSSGTRPIRELVHKHVVNMLSDSTSLMYIESTASGTAQFVGTGFGSSPNISMSFSLDGATIYFGGASPMLCPLPGKATLTAMYDVYKLDAVEVFMFIGSNAIENDLGAGLAAIQPMILFAPDTDDANNTTRDDLLQYSTAQLVQPTLGKPLYINVKPAAQINMTHLPGTSGLGRVFSPELNMASTSTPHYGLKLNCGLMKSIAVESHCQIGFAFKFHLTCKSTR